jgi:hypothetical protein
MLCPDLHFVGSTRHLVTTAGHFVSSAGHFVAAFGHRVGLLGQTVVFVGLTVGISSGVGCANAAPAAPRMAAANVPNRTGRQLRQTMQHLHFSSPGILRTDGDVLGVEPQTHSAAGRCPRTLQTT